MKTLQYVIIMLLSLTAGWGGYYLRGLHEERMLTLPTSLPELDHYIYEQSFSEVENAKALLQALSTRYVTEVRVRRYLDRMQSLTKGKSRLSGNQQHLSGTIEELAKGVEVFEGTGQELDMTANLLRALESAREYDQWVELYLRALYDHPTHGLVGDFASKAITIGHIAGRLKEVLRGFSHLSTIPFDFETRQHIEKLLTSPTIQDRLSPVNGAFANVVP